MKTITITFTDEAYRLFYQAVRTRQLSGMGTGIPDYVLTKLLDELEDGTAEYTFRSRKEREAETSEPPKMKLCSSGCGRTPWADNEICDVCGLEADARFYAARRTPAVLAGLGLKLCPEGHETSATGTECLDCRVLAPLVRPEPPKET